MKILLLGSGGREHVIFTKLQQTKEVEVFITPGNGGIDSTSIIKDINICDPFTVVDLAKKLAVDLVVIGPEQPLVAGVADALRAHNIPCFGPNAAAARIEGSKIFAKEIMQDARVATAQSLVVHREADLGTALAQFSPPYVVKDDGLAAGKGVVVTEDIKQAQTHALEILQSGHRVLLETYIDGPEMSQFCFVSGNNVIPLLPAQDYKRLLDGNLGPNTGGMGAYTPLPWVSQDIISQIVAEVVKPVVKELVKRNSSFTGLLYAGLALDKTGPKVIEFNCRFGDPETQAILPLLKTPLVDILYQTAVGDISDHTTLTWEPKHAVTVVLAAPGYPDNVKTEVPIQTANQPLVFHAGTKVLTDGTLVNTGGRVLNVVGVDTDLVAARNNAYQKLEQISFVDGIYRRDIALNVSEIKIPS